MNKETCPECNEESNDFVLCEDCCEKYISSAEDDAELRYYKEGRYES